MQLKSPLAALSVALAMLAPGVATAQVNNPPLLPQAITIFPSRDFVSVEGFAANADLTISVRRDGTEVSDAVGRTDATGLLEVNHPGGVCWRNVTPDIVAGDTIRVTYRGTANNQALGLVQGTGSAANTLNATATQAVQQVVGPDPNLNNVVIVKGNAALANGSRIPIARLEVRIVQPAYRETTGSRITRRDIRADSAGGRVDGVPGGSGTLAYDTATSTTFTAVFRGLNAVERQLTVDGQTRAMAWQQTTAAGDRLGMTIFEVGEVGGPGFGGCPPGPGGVVPTTPPAAPVPYNPGQLVDATQPQPALVTVFPERDFVSIEGFPAGTDLQVVVRRGTGPTPIIGTARGVVPSGGIFEINHPGGICWSGQTPDIQPGDWVDAFSVVSLGFNAGQKQQVIGAQVTRRATVTSDGRVRVDGTAVDPRNGAPFPLANVEQRIINPDFIGTAGSRITRRDIRADTAGGRVDGVPGATALLQANGAPAWRVFYTGLNATEAQLAVAGQARAMAWFSTNANGDRFGLTISEFGEVGGPGFGGCPATGTATIPLP
jgi:hypothetical protein